MNNLRYWRLTDEELLLEAQMSPSVDPALFTEIARRDLSGRLAKFLARERHANIAEPLRAVVNAVCPEKRR